MIAIIDYGVGNLHSVYNALTAIDCPCVITCDPIVIQASSGMILPGVGAFKDCMQNLQDSNVIDVIRQEVNNNKPILGICLGMQVMFEKGYEVEACDGLGFLQGEVTLMRDQSVKIPHIGWNQLQQVKEDPILEANNNVCVYYVHSYSASNYDINDVVAFSEYGNLKIVGYVHKGNILGMQYHPEKSGKEGLAMLNKFKEMCV